MTRPTPVVLPPNRFDHFYVGGDRITALRGGPGGLRRPEEWVASATSRAGQAIQGLSQLPDGTLLGDALRADPTAWLGKAHLARYGAGLELLVKLLDAGQRLPVHLHPTRAFARQHLGLTHGKTEAWVVVEATPGAVVGLGLRTELSRADVADLVHRQDVPALVEALHTREVAAGDGVLVPAGTPHFIGEGVFVVEVQEPTDLSILLEWEGFALDGPREGHLDLGFDVALDALDRTVWTSDDVDSRIVRTVRAGQAEHAAGLTAALPPDADPYFRAHHVDTGAGPTRVPPGFAVLVVLDGTGEIHCDDASALAVTRGDAVVVPWCAGGWFLDGTVRGVLCRPPAPDAPEAPR